MSQSKPANPDPVRIANRFDIVSKLGAGAFGTVFKAKDNLLGRMVAIKTIRLEGLAAQGASIDEMLERFGREARVAAQLKHPNIVTIYDFGTDQGLSYLAMEFIDGIGLDRLIANEGRIPAERAALIAAQFADALDYAHKHSVVHRDIKPANIMIESGDRVKVTDFGIAKATDSGEHLTMTGSLLGTPSYMSPEQARGSSLDGRSDLFAAGCVLYEMVTGKKAFRGESITGLIFKIITEEPPSMLEIDPMIPEPMVRIVAKALAKTPETRYQSGKELADDLLALTRSGSWPTVRQSETPTAPGAAQTPVPAGATIVSSAPTALSPSAPAAPTVVGSPAAKGPTPPPPPPPAPGPARTAIGRTPPPPAPPRPAPSKGGGGVGLLIVGLLAVLFVGVLALGGGWYFLSHRGNTQVAGKDPTPATPSPDATATEAPSSATTEPATPPPSATAEGIAAETPEPSGGSKTRLTGTRATAEPESEATLPPTKTRKGQRTDDDSGVPPKKGESGETRTASTGKSGDYSFLDQEQETPQMDGEESGRRVADAYGSSQGGGNTGGYGVGARLRARARSPRNLAPPERPAVATIRYLMNAEENYKKKNGRYGSLADLLQAFAVLDVKAQGDSFTRAGYRFDLSAKSDTFDISATPLAIGPRPFVGGDSGFIRAGTE